MPLSPRTPKMGLVKPTPGGDLFDWCLELNEDLDIIDGYGAPYGVASLNIDGDLTFNGHDITDIRAVGFDPQLTPISASGYPGRIYAAGNELYYNDFDNHQVKITNNGVVNGGDGYNGFIEETINANYTIDAVSATNFFRLDPTGGAFTVTLPQAADAGQRGYYFADISGVMDDNNVDIDTQGGDTFVVSGAPAQLTLRIRRGRYLLVSDGVSKWMFAADLTYAQNLGIWVIDTSLTVDGSSTFNGNITVNGTSTFADSMTANGSVTLNEDVIIGNSSADNLTVNATTDFASPVTFSSQVVCNSDVTLGNASADDLVVGATSEFNAPATFNNPVVCNSDVTLGNASADALVVTATSVFNSPATFNGDVTLGNASADALSVVATATFSSPVTFTDNVTIGNASADVLSVVSTSTFTSPVTFTDNVTIGNASADDLVVGATAEFNAPATFNNDVDIGGIITVDVDDEIINIGGGASATAVNGESIGFNTYSYYIGNGNRPLLSASYIATPTSGTTTRDVKYKFIKFGGMNLANRTLDYTGDIRTGEYVTIARGAGGAIYTFTFKCNGTTVDNTIGENQWKTYVNISGADDDWQVVQSGPIL